MSPTIVLSEPIGHIIAVVDRDAASLPVTVHDHVLTPLPDWTPMSSSAFLSLVAKRLHTGVVFAVIAILSLALLSGCAEGGDAEAADDSSWNSGSTPTAEGSEQPGAALETTNPARESTRSTRAGPADEDKPAGTEEGRAGGSAPGTALAMLDELKVKGRAPKTGYDSDLFKWRSDADHNGCDTRNDVLRRDLRDLTLKAGTKGCVVIAGDLTDQYKGETYAFDRSPNNIDIDHIVARSNAWQTGAASFDADTLKEFGNDPLNLLAVSSSLNRQKGDGDAATWLPPAKSFRCEYVSRQIAIKHKYELWVVNAEKSAMQRVLDACADEPAFAQEVSWLEPGQGRGVTTTEEEQTKPGSGTSSESSSGGGSESGPAGASGTTEKSKSGSSGSGSVHFKNCTAARDAGAAPVHRGDPGYASHLDRDGDGVGCE